MTYLYLVTALYLTFLVCTIETGNFKSHLVFKFPPMIGALVYGILAAKGFGLI